MSRRDQISFAPTTLLYGTRFDYSSLPRVADAAMAAGIHELRVKLLVSEVSLPRLLSQSEPGTRHQLDQTYSSDSVWSGRLRGTFGRKHRVVLSGNLLVMRHGEYPNVWLLVTDSQTDFLRQPLRYLLKSLRPRPSAPIIRSPQMADLLRLLRAHSVGEEMRVIQVGYRSRINSPGASKTVERDRKWTDLELDEAFAEAVEAGNWVTDARVEYQLRTGEKALVSIGRYGVMTFHRRCGLALEVLMTPTARLVNEWNQFLRDRGRTKTHQYRSRPFNITFTFPALDSPAQVALLKRTLLRIPAVTCTVVHGNPYFHAVMVDYQDGSTYEVAVLDQSRITILPQGRTSVRALQRLCSQIFADFREGELQELPDEG
jgi:hypothetical protein